MDPIFKYLVVFIQILTLLDLGMSDTYSVKIGTEQHVNLVDSKFLSFTIDPKFLFGSSEKYNNKHCICMASSLTPAYLRIAGPSTSSMIFRNTTISLDEPHASPTKEDQQTRQDKFPSSLLTGRKHRQHTLTHKQWERFIHWAKKTGFELVFALNHEEKMASGMWDPNVALNTLTLAEKADVGDMVWQLGYECTNQSIEEYLNDLETLRVIVETFPPGRSPSWRVVGGDITHCLQADSKSDFKDYVTLSNDMMDAIFLNGNSSAQQLERMTETNRLKLLRLLSHSSTPLWLTEKMHSQYNELERAADWLASLGYSARNGFSVHFRELLEEELHEPTLSFYMALIYKNLVGARVLNVDIAASQAALFAHCTSLRHKPVPGAVTLYGANMDDEPARFSLKLSKKEEGGDIMQFIFGHDNSGNIIVNGRAMYLEGDIRPVVKRVRPYKTLLINLPPKSFGFWVLANTQVNACIYRDEEKKEKDLTIAIANEVDDIEAENVIKSRRSLKRKRDVIDLDKSFQVLDDHYEKTDIEIQTKNDILRKQIDNLNNELKNFHEILITKKDQQKVDNPTRHKRQAEKIKKIDTNNLKSKFSKTMFDKQFDLKSSLIDKLLQFKNEKLMRLGKRRINKKSYKRSNTKGCSAEYFNSDEDTERQKTRRRRSVINENIINKLEKNKRNKQIQSKLYKETSENEVDGGEDFYPVDNILHKLKESLRHLPVEMEENVEKVDNEQESETSELTLKTKLSEDGAVIDISEKTNHGLLRSTFEDLISLLGDMNKHLNRFWSTFTLLE